MKQAITSSALAIAGTLTGGALAYAATTGPDASALVLVATVVFGALAFVAGSTE